MTSAAIAQTTGDRIVFRDYANVNIANAKGVGPWYHHFALGDSCLIPAGGILEKKSFIGDKVIARVEYMPAWFVRRRLWNMCPGDAQVYMNVDTWNSFVAGNGMLRMFADEEQANKEFAQKLKELSDKK